VIFKDQQATSLDRSTLRHKVKDKESLCQVEFLFISSKVCVGDV
jgi:hypothetical protein